MKRPPAWIDRAALRRRIRKDLGAQRDDFDHDDACAVVSDWLRTELGDRLFDAVVREVLFVARQRRRKGKNNEAA